MATFIKTPSHFNLCSIMYISDEIKSLQKHALRIILPNHSYAEASNQLDHETLQNRRENLSTKIFQNNLDNAYFQDYLPERNAINYELRNNGHFRGYRCHTEQFNNYLFFPQRISRQ